MIRALTLLSLWAGVALANPVTVEELSARLEKSATGVQSLSGEFTQRNKLKLFKQELRSKGRFYYQRPRRVRWEYLSPDPSTLILDGETASLRTPGAAAQRFDLAHDATMRAIFDQLVMWLGPGSLAAAKSDYDLSIDGDGDGDGNGDSNGSAAEPRLILVPKASSAVAKAFARIELRLDGKSLLMRSILLTEKNGDEKEITFTRLQKNAPLPPDAFR